MAKTKGPCLSRDRVGQGHEFFVATECFCVAIKLARPGVFYRDIMFLCRDRVWPNGEVLCCDRAILCCNIVGQAGEIFGRGRGFLGRHRIGQGKGKLCRDRASLCCDRVGQSRENFCCDRGFLGRDKAGHDRKPYRTR